MDPMTALFIVATILGLGITGASAYTQRKTAKEALASQEKIAGRQEKMVAEDQRRKREAAVIVERQTRAQTRAAGRAVQNKQQAEGTQASIAQMMQLLAPILQASTAYNSTASPDQTALQPSAMAFPPDYQLLGASAGDPFIEAQRYGALPPQSLGGMG